MDVNLAAAKEIARQLPTLQASRRELQSQLDRLLGQIRTIGSPDELRTRLQEDETRLTALQQEYDAITLAMQALSAANTTLQNRFSPALGARAAEIFAALSGGRYDKVLLSRDFALSAEPSGDAAARSIQLLSQGTADQLYLAVRLAVCELVLPAEEPCPLVLDDALANFDDGRCALALEALLRAADLPVAGVARLCLAGSLGAHVCLEDLETLGFLPAGLARRTEAVGNTALEGAALLARCPERGAAVARLCCKAHVLALTQQPDFAHDYLRQMRFGG